MLLFFLLGMQACKLAGSHAMGKGKETSVQESSTNPSLAKTKLSAQKGDAVGPQRRQLLGAELSQLLSIGMC